MYVIMYVYIRSMHRMELAERSHEQTYLGRMCFCFFLVPVFDRGRCGIYSRTPFDDDDDTHDTHDDDTHALLVVIVRPSPDSAVVRTVPGPAPRTEAGKVPHKHTFGGDATSACHLPAMPAAACQL